MKIESGFAYYGQRVGVLVFASLSPRIPGDPGCADSFRYPVQYAVAEGGFQELVEGSERVYESLASAGERLVHAGARAILGDCGLMSLYQTRLAARWGVPFAGSALCQLPLVWQLIGRTGGIGVITGHAALLGRAHLEQSGWEEGIPLCVQGMEEEPHFSEIVIRGGLQLDADAMRRDVLSAAKKLMERQPGLRAIVLECSNLATYAADVADFTGLPVFDVMTAANLLAQAVAPPRYPLR